MRNSPYHLISRISSINSVAIVNKMSHYVISQSFSMILPIYPGKIPQTSPNPDYSKEIPKQNCWWRVRGTFQGYGEILEFWKILKNLVDSAQISNLHHVVGAFGSSSFWGNFVCSNSTSLSKNFVVA